MSVDPSHYLPGSTGGKPPLLKIVGVSARPELNGQFGQAVSFSAGRYVVALLDAATVAAQVGGAGGGGTPPQPTMLKLKPENLTEAGSIDQLKFGAGMAMQSAKAYAASPAVQGWGQKIIERMPPALQAKMTPNMALFGAAAAAQLVLVMIYFLVGKFVGFTKLFALISLVALVVAVSSPDWMEGYKARKPFGLIAQGAARNFTRRWKENIVQMTGYHNISDRMALASFALIVLFTGKILLTPAPSPVPSMPMGGGAHRVPPAPSAPQYDPEHIYKLGFDDAQAGKEFGTSLPDDVVGYNAAQEEAVPSAGQYDDPNFEWAYNPPPPPPKKSTLGMGTMLSMFTLYRFGKDLVTSPDGQVVLDPAYVMARLRSLDSWRLGLMAMSLYRVVNALIGLTR